MSTELLKKVYLFESLDAAELVDVLKLCTQERYEGERFIFLEGDMSDKCYVITDGNVIISKHVQEVGEETLAVLKTGSYFGEMALIDGAPRSASAVTSGETTCLVLDKADLEKLMAENPLLGNKLLRAFCRTLSKRLRESNEKISGLVKKTPEPGGTA